jgi:nicotinamidase-related amidase
MTRTNPALLIIDMQRWFFGTEESRAKLPVLLTGINDLADYFHSRHLPVFHILTVHKPDMSAEASLIHGHPKPLRRERRMLRNCLISTSWHPIELSTRPAIAHLSGQKLKKSSGLDVNSVVLAVFHWRPAWAKRASTPTSETSCPSWREMRYGHRPGA